MTVRFQRTVAFDGLSGKGLLCIGVACESSSSLNRSGILFLSARLRFRSNSRSSRSWGDNARSTSSICAFYPEKRQNQKTGHDKDYNAAAIEGAFGRFHVVGDGYCVATRGGLFLPKRGCSPVRDGAPISVACLNPYASGGVVSVGGGRAVYMQRGWRNCSRHAPFGYVAAWSSVVLSISPGLLVCGIWRAAATPLRLRGFCLLYSSMLTAS